MTTDKKKGCLARCYLLFLFLPPIFLFAGIQRAEAYERVVTVGLYENAPNIFISESGKPSGIFVGIIDHIAESEYYRSLKRWTSEEVRFKFPAWAPSVGVAVGLAVIVILIGILFLRRQVDARTKDLMLINQEMEQRIIARTAELAEAVEKAQAADRIKLAFLSTMSNELRNPLNSIIGITGIILQGLAGPLNTEQHKQLGMAHDSARRLLALINDLLDIFKIEAGELIVESESFDLAASIGKVTGIVTPMAAKKGLAMSINISEGVGSLVSDASRFEQIIFNLLSNAIKFTETGSVTLTAEPVADYILKEGSSPSQAVRLSVADTGIGIKPEEMSILFAPFGQIDSTLTRVHEGKGLGLAISRRLAALLGGTIEAESRPGEGSVFTLILPLNPST